MRQFSSVPSPPCWARKSGSGRLRQERAPAAGWLPGRLVTRPAPTRRRVPRHPLRTRTHRRLRPPGRPGSRPGVRAHPKPARAGGGSPEIPGILLRPHRGLAGPAARLVPRPSRERARPARPLPAARVLAAARPGPRPHPRSRLVLPPKSPGRTRGATLANPLCPGWNSSPASSVARSSRRSRTASQSSERPATRPGAGRCGLLFQHAAGKPLRALDRIHRQRHGQPPTGSSGGQPASDV
jgi:hypothetical protein